MTSSARSSEAAEVARRVDREGYKQVERSLGDMQSQIARLNQDLSFYRGLVQPDSLIHVKVQQMQIVPEAAPGQFRLKFVLMQTGKPDNEVTGSAAIAIDGLLQGKPLSLSFAQVSPQPPRQPGILLPVLSGLRRTHTIAAGVRADARRGRDSQRQGRDPSHSFRQAFVWKAQGMSVETEANGANPAAKGEADVQTETE